MQKQPFDASDFIGFVLIEGVMVPIRFRIETDRFTITAVAEQGSAAESLALKVTNGIAQYCEANRIDISSYQRDCTQGDMVDRLGFPLFKLTS